MLAAHENLEDQLVAFVAVFTEQRIDVLDRRSFERLESVPIVDVPDNPHHVFAAAYIVWQEIAHAARGLRTH